MQLVQQPIKLIPFLTSYLKTLAAGRLNFEFETLLNCVEDWPNEQFLEAIPFFLEGRVNNTEEEKWSFLIIRELDNRIVGEIGSKGPPNKLGEIEVGYGIAKSCRGSGIGTTALNEFIKHAFSENMKAVVAECLENNLASIRTLERCGFTSVGTKISEEGQLRLWRLDRQSAF